MDDLHPLRSYFYKWWTSKRTDKWQSNRQYYIGGIQQKQPHIIFDFNWIDRSGGSPPTNKKNKVIVHGFKVQGRRVKAISWKVKAEREITIHRFRFKMLISQNTCQFGFKFWIRPDEAGAFLVNTHPRCSPGTWMEPLNPEPLIWKMNVERWTLNVERWTLNNDVAPLCNLFSFVSENPISNLE